MLNIVIGYDQNEPIAFHVLAHSIMSRASAPVCIIPLTLDSLKAAGWHDRPRDLMQSTDFTYSRFLAPWLGMAHPTIFMDCDMLCRCDIYEVMDLVNHYDDVSVVKHDYVPKAANKFLEQPQTVYPCKNWSSFMVFNPYRQAVRRLEPDYVNKATGMDLHQFKWADNVGSLPLEWNHLVGEYSPNPDAKIVHFTRGGPWFPNFADCEYAQEWWEEYDKATFCKTTIG